MNLPGYETPEQRGRRKLNSYSFPGSFASRVAHRKKIVLVKLPVVGKSHDVLRFLLLADDDTADNNDDGVGTNG